MTKRVTVIIVGFGNVGRSLAKTIAYKYKDLENRYDVSVKVAAILDSSGCVIKEEGFSPYELIQLCDYPRSNIKSFNEYGKLDLNLEDIYNIVSPDIHVEVTPSNYENGEPGLNNILFAITNGINIVTSNKAPLALKYDYIMKQSRKKNVYVKFKATVMAGTPLIDLLMSLKCYEINSIEGILNSTTNFILTEMHEKLISFDEALTEALALGIAESNYTLDIKGLDSAAKLTIISNIIGRPINIRNVELDDLSNINIKEIYRAIRSNLVLKFIAKLDVINEKAFVKLMKIPKTDMLSSVGGLLNAVKISTDINKIILIGKGAGGTEAAHAIIDDMISIVKG